MPDPVDPTPVHVKKVGDKFAVVDKNGDRLDGQELVGDSDAAAAVAARVNASWSKVKSERKSKGGPEITEAWSDAARRASAAVRHGHGDLVQHRHDGAQGRVEGPEMNGRVPVRFHTGDRDPNHVFHIKSEDLESLERPKKLAEALGELEESIVPFVPHREGAISTHYDPRLHPRDRIGEFAHLLGGVKRGKGMVTLPHGITVRSGFGGRLQVSARGGTAAVFTSPHVAAAHALHLHDSAEIEKGADPEAMHGRRLDELAGARRTAILSQDPAGAEHVESLQRGLRLERRERAVPVVKHGGGPYSRAELAAYRGRAEGAGALAGFFAQPHVSPAHLPPASRVADQTKPFMSEDGAVHTGYGVFHVKEHEGTTGIYDLHHDDTNLGTVGNRGKVHDVMAAMHDEAMVRHVMATRSRKEKVLGQMRPPGGSRFQHEVRQGKPVVTDRGKTWAGAFSHDHAIRQANKLNAAVGSPEYAPDLRPGDHGDFEHQQDEHGLTKFTVTGFGKLGAEGDEHDHMPYTAVKGESHDDAPIPSWAVPPPSEWWLLANGTVMDPTSGSIVGTHQYAKQHMRQR